MRNNLPMETSRDSITPTDANSPVAATERLCDRGMLSLHHQARQAPTNQG
jgi:hypothetical protein